MSAAQKNPDDTPSLIDLTDKINLARSLVELVYMAAHHFLPVQKEAANALTAGCDAVDKLLGDATDMIEAISAAEEGGEK